MRKEASEYLMEARYVRVGDRVKPINITHDGPEPRRQWRRVHSAGPAQTEGRFNIIYRKTAAAKYHTGESCEWRTVFWVNRPKAQ